MNQDLKFSQAGGWEDVAEVGASTAPDGESWDDYLRRVGVTRGHEIHYLEYRSMLDSDGDWPRPAYVRVNTVDPELSGGFRYMVEVMSREPHRDFDFVWLQSKADLYALMNQPMFAAMASLDLLDDLRTAIARLFHAYHDHDVDDVCRRCDPTEEASRRRYSDRAKKALEKGRV